MGKTGSSKADTAPPNVTSMGPPSCNITSGRPLTPPLSQAVPVNSNQDMKSIREFFGGRSKRTAQQKKKILNRKLHRILKPKTAIVALREFEGIEMSDFVINSRMEGGFTAEVTVNNIQYEEYGPSKLLAKNSSCEKALRDLIISRMKKNPSLNFTEANDAIEVDQDNSDEEEVNNLEIDDYGDDVEMKHIDDVPMQNLASFGLYKLFSDWEKEGFQIPNFSNEAKLVKKRKKSPKIRNELPENWREIHPTSLLCRMQPEIKTIYYESNVNETKVHKIGIIVNGEEFIGVGSTKTIARREAASQACDKLFGTTYSSSIIQSKSTDKVPITTSSHSQSTSSIVVSISSSQAAAAKTTTPTTISIMQSTGGALPTIIPRTPKARTNQSISIQIPGIGISANSMPQQSATITSRTYCDHH